MNNNNVNFNEVIQNAMVIHFQNNHANVAQVLFGEVDLLGEEVDIFELNQVINLILPIIEDLEGNFGENQENDDIIIIVEQVQNDVEVLLNHSMHSVNLMQNVNQNLIADQQNLSVNVAVVNAEILAILQILDNDPDILFFLAGGNEGRNVTINAINNLIAFLTQLQIHIGIVLHAEPI